ncbi:ETC complex I subunit conserved region-domain-containing protein [Scheffersomyces coipomensis]|uniref:ETC complex I subunit conserved region-domain-containing protein n=1 Tax=Scheffersomyces coipomensis TaxID=1788519 RepID=UPI00315DBBB1
MLSRISVRALALPAVGATRGSIRLLSVTPIRYQSSVPDVTPTTPSFTGTEIVSGAPKDLITSRVVRIYQEAKAATQSGHHNGSHWKLDWDVLGQGNRWENDLMGYQGSADYMQGTIMHFDTKEAAINFAERQGWDHYVQEPKKRHFRKKDYSANFYHSAGPLKHIRTK